MSFYVPGTHVVLPTLITFSYVCQLADFKDALEEDFTQPQNVDVKVSKNVCNLV